jgi:hypothetical protein
MEYALHPEVYDDLDEIHGYFEGFNPSQDQIRIGIST